MGKRGRGKGHTGAATRARDRDAQEIASAVYSSCVAARPYLGAAPLWATGPLAFVAECVTEIVLQRNPELRAEAEDVAAYVAAVFSDVLIGVGGSFDVERFRAWQAVARGEVAASG